MDRVRSWVVAMLFVPAAVYAQNSPSLDLNASIVTPGGSMRVTISGQPGDHYVLLASQEGSGWIVGPFVLDLVQMPSSSRRGL